MPASPTRCEATPVPGAKPEPTEPSSAAIEANVWLGAAWMTNEADFAASALPAASTLKKRKVAVALMAMGALKVGEPVVGALPSSVKKVVAGSLALRLTET